MMGPTRVLACTSKVSKMMAQYPTIRECRQCRVHYFGAILPVLSVSRYCAIVLGILEVGTWESRGLDLSSKGFPMDP